MKLKLEINVRDMIDRLRRLEKNAAKKVARKIVTAGAKVLVRAVKDAVPTASGALRKAIGQKVKVYRGSAVGVVGARAGFDADKYAHFPNVGTRPHKIGRRKHPGIRAQKYIGRAMEDSAGAIRSAMIAVGEAALEEGLR